jgi:dTDP-4-dehydrorhamnose reductase
MRVLVTGVTGQVGGSLIPLLAPLGTVVAADRAMLDLAQPQSIPGALDRFAPNLIINPAAYTAVDKAEDEPELAMAINGTAPGILARWAAANGIALIHFSTDYVFDGAGEQPWREDDQPRPLSVYGMSKLVGEREIRAAGGPHLIVRTSWVYAAKGRNFLRTIVRLARERTELSIVADQVGAPTSAALIADALTGIIDDGSQTLTSRMAASNGIVHLAASGETSWHQFATSIIDGLRQRGVPLAVERVIPIRTEDYPTRAIRPRNSRLDLGRMTQVFGVTTPDWEVALARELDDVAYDIGV